MKVNPNQAKLRILFCSELIVEKNMFFGRITSKPASQLYSRASLRCAARLMRSQADALPGCKNLMPTSHLPCPCPPGKKARRGTFPGTSGHRSPRTGQPPRAAAAHYFCFSNLSTAEHHQLCTRITGAWRGSVTERPIMTMNNSNAYAPCSFDH